MSPAPGNAIRLPRARRAQRGVILIISLALLLMLTLLSIGMFRSLGLEERITGNTREKQHAFFAAQTALEYAETWIDSGNASFGTSCSQSSTSATPVICTQASSLTQAQLATDNWSGYFGTPYSPPSVTINGTVTAQTTTYTQAPTFTITYLGADPAKSGAYLYQVTSLGFGNNLNATAVVQSVYSVGSGGSCVSCSH